MFASLWFNYQQFDLLIVYFILFLWLKKKIVEIKWCRDCVYLYFDGYLVRKYFNRKSPCFSWSWWERATLIKKSKMFPSLPLASSQDQQEGLLLARARWVYDYLAFRLTIIMFVTEVSWGMYSIVSNKSGWGSLGWMISEIMAYKKHQLL